MSSPRKTAVLTVDFEDYRRQQLRDVLGEDVPPAPDEVTRQFEILLELFAACDAEATFLAVGRLTKELPSSVWSAIIERHRLGAHSYEHGFVRHLGPSRFAEDVRIAKSKLEDVSGVEIISFRAPYFSNDGCDPWYGEILAANGYRIDSSVRLPQFPGESSFLIGSDDRVLEIPLRCYGIGSKRLTVIGGTYFRLLPLALIRQLLFRAAADGFVPMIYLHPYDIDASAAALDFLGRGTLLDRAGDLMRRTGRATVSRKLLTLAKEYRFISLERYAMERHQTPLQVVNS